MNQRIAKALVNGGLIVLSAIVLMPMLWMLSVSFMQTGEASTYPPPLLPAHATWANYHELFERAGMLPVAPDRRAAFSLQHPADLLRACASMGLGCRRTARKSASTTCPQRCCWSSEGFAASARRAITADEPVAIACTG